jgi:hypothetical protein
MILHMITPAERETLLERLHSSRDFVHQTVQGLSDEQLRYRPEPDRWSVAENLEHITLVELRILEGLMRTLEQPSDMSKKSSITDEQLFQNFGRVVQPLTAPEPFRPSSRWPLAELLGKFDAARERTLEFAATAADKDLRRHFMPHPFFGELDCYQWFVLVAGHSSRHCHQCDRVKASPGYPR